MGIETLILILIGFMVIAALIAAETRDLLSSVISLGAAGFALSAANLLLGAPDLAITQVVVEVIALVLLIRVVVTRKDSSTASHRDGPRTAAVLLTCGVLLAGVFLAFGGLEGLGERGVVPPFGQPLLTGKTPGVAKDYLDKSVQETGAANVVGAILLDYRAYDTLGEATVIFTAIVGAYAILRRVGRRRKEEQPS